MSAGRLLMVAAACWMTGCSSDGVETSAAPSGATDAAHGPDQISPDEKLPAVDTGTSPTQVEDVTSAPDGEQAGATIDAGRVELDALAEKRPAGSNHAV